VGISSLNKEKGCQKKAKKSKKNGGGGGGGDGLEGETNQIIGKKTELRKGGTGIVS